MLGKNSSTFSRSLDGQACTQAWNRDLSAFSLRSESSSAGWAANFPETADVCSVITQLLSARAERRTWPPVNLPTPAEVHVRARLRKLQFFLEQDA